MRILFAEDEKVTAVLLREYCQVSGHDILVASNGKEALDILMLNSIYFDIVITDFAMPVMDGELLIACVRNVRPDIPILLWTAHNVSGFGEDFVLNKPSLPEELMVVAQALLEEHEENLNALRNICQREVLF